MPVALRPSEVRARTYAELLGEKPPAATKISRDARGPGALTVTEYELLRAKRPCALLRPSADGSFCARCGHKPHAFVWKRRSR